MTKGSEPAYPGEGILIAFPADLSQEIKDKIQQVKISKTGMTKREVMAMAAMQGAIGSAVHWYDMEKSKTSAELLARNCCIAADALLAELSKEKD